MSPHLLWSLRSDCIRIFTVNRRMGPPTPVTILADIFTYSSTVHVQLDARNHVYNTIDVTKSIVQKAVQKHLL
jgi:hypothetical protein